MTKRFTRTIKQGLALLAALLFVYTAHAQQLTPGDFVVAYTFPSGDTDVQFFALTNGTVNYSFQVYNNGTPTTSSGSGSFMASASNAQVSIAGTLTSGSLALNAGDSIVISFAPTNLQRFYNCDTTSKTYYAASAGYLTDVLQWGNVHWSSMMDMFMSCTALKNFSATDAPDLSGVTDMYSMFCGASSFNGNIDDWNTSNVTNMSYMFCTASVFNQNLNDWNTANVTDMSFMFSQTDSFNGNIGNWNTSNVKSMYGMFISALAFNQPIGNWDVSNVVNMQDMFAVAIAFNQDISGWNTSNVLTMNEMFIYASAFNQNLGNWNLSSIIVLPNCNDSCRANAQSNGIINLGMGNMLRQSGMDCSNYSLTLQGWAANLGSTTPAGMVMSSSNYPSNLSYNNDTATTAARAALVAAGWVFYDNGSTACPNTTALLVSLRSFTAQKQGNTALLQWQTAAESNNKGFAVQRSPDGQTWQPIGFVNSKANSGNSAQPLSYQYTDNSPLSGINYYRLQQQDLDGNISYSGVADVDFGILQTLVHPNPAKSVLNVALPADVGNVPYRMISTDGKVVLQGSMSNQGNFGQISVSGLASAVYFLQVTINNAVQTYKVQVQH